MSLHIICRKELPCRQGFFRSVENDQTVFDDGKTVRAFVQHITILQNLIVVDNGTVGVAEVAQVEGDAIGVQA